jgi:hypothetical protein
VFAADKHQEIHPIIAYCQGHATLAVGKKYASFLGRAEEQILKCMTPVPASQRMVEVLGQRIIQGLSQWVRLEKRQLGEQLPEKTSGKA